MGITYRPPSTVKKFMEDDSFVRCIMGPFGSGKSSGCSVEVLRRACQQAQFSGYRHSRWAVIRNTYRELADTTIRTFRDWVPESLGEFSSNQNIFRARFNDVNMEVMFRALDSPDDVKKLLSLELTGAWINEAKEVPRSILDALTGRVGRFPSRALGGASWSGIIMDTNPPDTDSSWYKFFEQDHSGYSFYQQPAASTKAQNIENLRPTTTKALAREVVEWVKSSSTGSSGSSWTDVHLPEFRHDIHTKDDIAVLPKHFPLVLGVDFGLTPAAASFRQTATDKCRQRTCHRRHGRCPFRPAPRAQAPRARS